MTAYVLSQVMLIFTVTLFITHSFDCIYEVNNLQKHKKTMIHFNSLPEHLLRSVQCFANCMHNRPCKSGYYHHNTYNIMCKEIIIAIIKTTTGQNVYYGIINIITCQRDYIIAIIHIITCLNVYYSHI